MLPGQYSAGDLKSLATLMGNDNGFNTTERALIKGWRVSAPVLLRDYSVLWDCSSGALVGAHAGMHIGQGCTITLAVRDAEIKFNVKVAPVTQFRPPHVKQ